MQRCLDNQTPGGPADHGAPRDALMAGQRTGVVGATTMVHSDDLLQGQRMLDIQHNGTVYRLQATRLGKLILTK